MSIESKIASLLEPPQKFVPKYNEDQLRDLARQLEACLVEYNCPCDVNNVSCGRVSTVFEVCPKSGIKFKQVESCEKEIQLRLHVGGAVCRQENARVLIEIPNGDTQVIKIRELLLGGKYDLKNKGLLVALGRRITGEEIFVDVASAPHLLVAGTTGSGKSVCLHTIITNLLLTKSPKELRFILIDPKMTELRRYSPVPHLLHDVIYSPETAAMESARALQGAVKEMYRRLSLLESIDADNISYYNAKMKELGKPVLPRIVIVIDEFETLMDIDVRKNKELKQIKEDLEKALKILVKLGRVAGIHLIIATQRPAAENVDKSIRDNLPTRICFRVMDAVSSLTVLGQSGAGGEKLQGNGDFLTPMINPITKRSELVHGQAVFVSKDEIRNVVEDCAGHYSKIRRLQKFDDAWDVENDLSIDFTRKENPVEDLFAATETQFTEDESFVSAVSVKVDRASESEPVETPPESKQVENKSESKVEQNQSEQMRVEAVSEIVAETSPKQMKSVKVETTEPELDKPIKSKTEKKSSAVEEKKSIVEKADFVVATPEPVKGRVKKVDEKNSVAPSIIKPQQKNSIVTGFVDICGERYKTIQVGSQKWLAENLRFKCDGVFSKRIKLGTDSWNECYYSSEVASRIKSQWRVPTIEDWQMLHNFIAKKSKKSVSANLKSVYYWRECGNVEASLDAFGFRALPVGYVDESTGKNIYVGEASYFWVAPEDDSDRLFVRTLDWASSVFALRRVDCACAASIRLVCDIEE